MCIDVIHEVFPGAAVAWERSPRVAKPMMTVDDTLSGDEVLTFLQRDMSDEHFGPGVAALKEALVAHKEAISQ
jgi:hypothetical protein